MSLEMLKIPRATKLNIKHCLRIHSPRWVLQQNTRFFFSPAGLVKEIVWKSIAGLACWTTVSLYRRAHSGGPSPWRHKQGMRLPSGEVSVWLHHLNWSIYGFHFLSCLCFLFLSFLSLSTPLFSSRPRAPTSLSLSFIHSLSLSLPLTGSRANIQEMI